MDSAAEAADVAKGGLILTAPSLHGATEGPLLFKSSTVRRMAAPLEPQSLSRQPARVYYTPVSAFALQRRPMHGPQGQ